MDIIGDPVNIYVDLLIPLLLIAGILLNSVAYLADRPWITFFSTFSMSIIAYLIFYGLIYTYISKGFISYSILSRTTSIVFINIFLSIIPVIVFTHLRPILKIERDRVNIRTHRKLAVTLDLSLSLITTFGLASLIYFINEAFYNSLKGSVNLAPIELRPLITNILNANIGQILILLIFVSLITFIIYGFVEPMTIYFGGLKGQAIDILKYEYSKIKRKDYKLLHPRLLYLILWASPVIVVGSITGLYNYLYIQDLYTKLEAYNPVQLIIKIILTYILDLTSFQNNAPMTKGDLTLILTVNWEDLEILLEYFRAILRFLFRLIF